MMRRKSVRGVITVFISLMLLSILSLGTLVLEAGRFQAAKMQLSEANISASTSMIASYNDILYQRYGLLAIDTEVFTADRYLDYLNFNSDLSADLLGNRVTRMYTIDSVEIMGLYNLTSPAILKRQILTRAKYHVIPQDYALNINTMNSFFIELQNKCQYVSDALAPVANGTASSGSSTDISPEMLLALSYLYETYKDAKKSDDSCDTVLNSSTVALLPSTTGSVDSTIPVEDIASINDVLNNVTTVLGSSGGNLQMSINPQPDIDVSVNVDFVALITETLRDITSSGSIPDDTVELAVRCVYLSQSISAAIDSLKSDSEGNLLLNSYIAAYFSNRNNIISGYTGPSKGSNLHDVDNAAFAAACVEYIFGGNASEQVNQEIAYDYIFAIRLINNLYSTFANSTSFDENNCYSVAAHIAWANFETTTDMQLLTKYNIAVPFSKNKMILPVESPSNVSSAFATKSMENALDELGYFTGETFVIPGTDIYSYKDSLAVALWLVPNSTKMMRVADLIQIEMRYYQQYIEHTTASFLMSEQNTFCRVKCTAKLNSILPIVSLGSNSGVNGISFSTVKYSGY